MDLPKLNKNDANFEARREFVASVISNVFGFKACNIQPIAYERDFPFPYNNFVYLIEAERTSSTAARLDAVSQSPGVQKIPPDLNTFIMRLSNHESGYNDKVRVQNEVAAMSIAREALQPRLSHLVPRIFGWKDGANGQGWILQERLPGESVLEDFGSIDNADKKCIL